MKGINPAKKSQYLKKPNKLRLNTIQSISHVFALALFVSLYLLIGKANIQLTTIEAIMIKI